MKGIEWIKLTVCTCEDEKMRLINAMEIRDSAFYLWIRLLLQAGKVNDNGLIYLKEDVPYTNKMLSILFERPLDIVEKVLKIFESFKMIEIYEDNIIRICNWEKHQNIEGMKRVREKTKERVKSFREKKQKENEDSNFSEALNNADNDNNSTNKISDNKNCNAYVTPKREKREKEYKNKNKNLDKEEKRTKEELKEPECTKEIHSTLVSKTSAEVKEVSHSFDELNVQAIKITKSLEEAKVKIKGLSLNWITEALSIHKEEYVKMALDKAIERKKFDINYIGGILKNWIREGYPKTYEEMEFGGLSSYNLSNSKEKPKLRFNNFESRSYDYDDLEKKLLGWKE